MNTPDFSGKFAWVKKLFWIALASIPFFALGVLMDVQALLIVGVILALPVVAYTYVLTFLHWKHRYIGDSSTLWGVLLAVETSGWFKIVYLFRHILPDMMASGRYRR